MNQLLINNRVFFYEKGIIATEYENFTTIYIYVRNIRYNKSSSLQKVFCVSKYIELFHFSSTISDSDRHYKRVLRKEVRRKIIEKYYENKVT